MTLDGLVPEDEELVVVGHLVVDLTAQAHVAHALVLGHHDLE